MCNHIINLESVIMMCNCDIKFSTKLCQMKCPKHTHHIYRLCILNYPSIPGIHLYDVDPFNVY